MFSGCNDNECHTALVDASFTENSQIDVSYNQDFEGNYFEVIPGENIVFSLIIQKAQCNSRYDDESSEFLHFEIAYDAQNFELNSENFLQAGCFYRQSAAWYTSAFMKINQGKISGEKISENEWHINISVTPTSRSAETPHQPLEYEGIFRKQI